jgi:hypothetical protein
MEHRLLQVIAGKTGLQAGELARERIRGLFLAGSSQALDESSKREMEDLTGYDLSAARIHSNFPAGSLARSLGAEAFTVGRHIFAPAEKINTSFSEGRGLLAHELTHVIQQTSPPRAVAGGRELPDIAGAESHAPLPLVQLARGTQAADRTDDTQRAMEAEAERRETAAREPARERTQQAEIDKDMLADMVYRLMQNELTVHCDRRR